MDRFTRGIAMASARHPWRTIATWVLVLGAVFFLAAVGGGTFADDFSVTRQPERPRHCSCSTENFPEAAKGKALVVFEAQDGTTLDEPAAEVAAVLERRRRPRPRRVGRRPVRGRHDLRRTAGSGTPC